MASSPRRVKHSRLQMPTLVTAHQATQADETFSAAHYQWLRIELARQHLKADAAAGHMAALRQQKHQLQDRISRLEAEVVGLKEAARTADAWETGVERLLGKLSTNSMQAAKELQMAQQCVQQQHGKRLKAAHQRIREQSIELEASISSAKTAWELYDSLVQQLGPLAVRAADAVSMLKQSDINVVRLSETDATGANQAYKAGVLKGAQVLAALAQLPHVIKKQLPNSMHGRSAGEASCHQPTAYPDCNPASSSAAAGTAPGLTLAPIADPVTTAAAGAGEGAGARAAAPAAAAAGSLMMAAAQTDGPISSPRSRLKSTRHRWLRKSGKLA